MTVLLTLMYIDCNHILKEVKINDLFILFKFFFDDVLLEIVFINAFVHIRVLSDLMVIDSLYSYFLYVFFQGRSWHNTIWTWTKLVKVEIFIILNSSNT